MANFWASVFHSTSFFSTKHALSYVLGDFFKNSSGRLGHSYLHTYVGTVAIKTLLCIFKYFCAFLLLLLSKKANLWNSLTDDMISKSFSPKNMA
jgi:hypothetical protein